MPLDAPPCVSAVMANVPVTEKPEALVVTFENVTLHVPLFGPAGELNSATQVSAGAAPDATVTLHLKPGEAELYVVAAGMSLNSTLMSAVKGRPVPVFLSRKLPLLPTASYPTVGLGAERVP